MDQENSSASSFEDLANLNENELKEMNDEVEAKKEDNSTTAEKDKMFMDILGNDQLTKRVGLN